ncbi:TetR/AcrR family transcriptional regulator [Lampropedia puyangensis]|uniref:TetR/AcrR family transcriptional regulator n=1 Tax=Lampropedia puyangensis TaxID=1330072 RepID=A0A4S8FCA5_9BURK|nr:TetR/AcrR family transcriptional regulator [Lampropedia puyangensis]THU05007.1 TetR/AcrR family transcriptional regulator [Lampropedia puyangensis]
MSKLRKSSIEDKQRDAERSRNTILVAAKQEFALAGFDGARIDRIAERAALNKRLIYYYFTDKEALFQAVLEEAYADIRQAEQALELASMQPPQAIAKLVEFTWHYYLANPEFLSILNSANLHKGRHLEEEGRVKRLNSPLMQLLREVLHKGQQQGAFRADADPIQLYITIAGMAYFYLANNYTLSAVFGADLSTTHAQDERLVHMCDVVLGYLKV